MRQTRSLQYDMSISRREQEVLDLIFEEYTSIEIAEKLFISKSTVETHRRHLLTKFDCDNTVGLIKRALQYRYVTMDITPTPIRQVS